MVGHGSCIVGVCNDGEVEGDASSAAADAQVGEVTMPLMVRPKTTCQIRLAM